MGRQQAPIPASASKRELASADATLQWPFGLVRRRFGWKQFCCKACLYNYLSRTTHEADRCRSWLKFFGSQGMTHARSVEYSVGPDSKRMKGSCTPCFIGSQNPINPHSRALPLWGQLP